MGRAADHQQVGLGERRRGRTGQGSDSTSDALAESAAATASPIAAVLPNIDSASPTPS
jgi:hypothetical protein